jgi:hypothetical protein
MFVRCLTLGLIYISEAAAVTTEPDLAASEM